MRRRLLAAAAACAAACPGTGKVVAQDRPIPLAAEVRLRHQILRGHGVTAFLLQIPPGQGTQMHRHDKDLLTVFISGGRTTAVFEGSPPKTDTVASGEVRYRTAGFAHSTRNDGSADFRTVLLEFDNPQGPSRPGAQGGLFCTDRFCVYDLTVQPGERLAGEGSAFFVPLGETVIRDPSGHRHLQPDGSIWWGRYGWTNEGVHAARAIAIKTL